MNGLRLPDPNMTVVEILTVASSVDTADDGASAGSDTLVIAVDPAGRVTTLIVDANPITPGETPSAHGDRYITTADYGRCRLSSAGPDQRRHGRRG